jgi:uncharacterized membrane protein
MPLSEACPQSCALRKSRLEAFSDGVLAIIITIMVLGLKVPHGDDLCWPTPNVFPIGRLIGHC